MPILVKKKINKHAKQAHKFKYVLRLYIVGETPNSITALNNLKKICKEYLDHQYIIETIDLLKFPNLAKHDQILAVPTLIKELPKPIRKIIGDLSNTEQVLVGLDLKNIKCKA